MSIVTSILEGIYGTKAFALWDYFSKKRKEKGLEGHRLLSMLVFFLWGFALQSLSLYFGFYKRVRGVIVLVCLLCMGNVMKWVTSTIGKNKS